MGNNKLISAQEICKLQFEVYILYIGFLDDCRFFFNQIPPSVPILLKRFEEETSQKTVIRHCINRFCSCKLVLISASMHVLVLSLYFISVANHGCIHGYFMNLYLTKLYILREFKYIPEKYKNLKILSN